MAIKKVSLKELKKKKKAILKGLKLKNDSEIDYSDSPELNLNDPVTLETIKIYSPIEKEEITIGNKNERHE